MTVVILSKNPANLVPCVAAVRAHEPEAWIVVVDDGLPVGTFSQLGGTVQCVSGVKPFIFARNANAGIIAAGQEDVILLNDDALLETPQGFSKLQQAARDNPGYGVIAATCNNVGNPRQRRQSGGKLRADPRMVCFVCVLIPRSTIELVGLLDDRYADYGCDDDDYCLECTRAGLKIGIFDGCYVEHGRLQSTFRGRALGGRSYQRNLQLYGAKWGAVEAARVGKF